MRVFASSEASARLMAGTDTSEQVSAHVDESPLAVITRWQASRPPSISDLRDFYSTVARCMRMENSLPKALNLVVGLTTHLSLQFATAQAIERLQTKPVPEAMEAYRGILPDAHLALFGVGSEAGELPAVLEALSLGVVRTARSVNRLQSAMYYPAIVLLMGIGVVGFVSYKLLPTLAGLYKSLRAELPVQTQVLQWISATATANPIIPLLLVAGGTYFVFSFKTLIRHPAVENILMKTPVVGPIFFKADLAKCFMSMALMLRAGVPLPLTMQLTSTVATHHRLRRFFSALHYAFTREAKTLHLAASTHRAFLGVDARLVLPSLRLGEETGTLRESVEKLSEYYTDEVENRSKTAETLVEPITYIGLGALVFFLVMAIFYPLLKLNVMIMPK